ncbi:carboxy terminal-processing peptidase [Gangjinia marincola]|uniref:Carboxy terminal-processing peptidase n=1 Tax=Gangjinia marincola TaxID=578463 RepID=A0ABN1MH85_9FLAO
MKRHYKVFVLAFLFTAASFACTTSNRFNDPDKDKVLLDLITFVLEKGHYDPKDIDDEFSKTVYKDFITELDPLKQYFTAKDIKEFGVYETSIDDQIKEKEITFFNVVFDRFMKRQAEGQTIYKEILATPFDFSKEENIDTDYENIPYAENDKDLKERWRKILKYMTLGTYFDKIREQEDAEDTEEKLTQSELEKASREITLESMDNSYENRKDLERKDYFTFYINAIVETFDPHTYYFAPQNKDRFDTMMSGRLEGIGARLQKNAGNIKVIEIISGGPAWRNEQLEVGDFITKVKQEDEEEPVSVMGMRLDDAVSLIKGPKGTQVTLTVKKVDGTLEDISITRDVVELEETYAKTAMVEEDGQKFGVINLPKFYFNMEDYKERNAASDMKQEIERLKEEGMEGLVIDLRNNGGGSLSTVVDIAGLFIEDGPVVQVKSKSEEREVLKDRDKSIVWNGPLVILVNELSASASEILAGAMQDYKRAIIIGGKQTYGKATVQNVVDLNRWMRNSDLGDMGALKVTTQKYYRVSGESNQLKGVESDVVVPTRYSFMEVGEKDLSNPLPWDEIERADFTPWQGYIDYKETIKKSKDRMQQNEYLALIEENAKWINSQRDVNEFPLSFNTYRSFIEQTEEESKRFDSISEYNSNLTFESLAYEKDLFKSDEALKEKRERWHKNLAKDVYIEEALNVLKDLKATTKNTKLAQIKD